MTFDLMDRGWALGDIGHRLTWVDIRHFVQGLMPDSALQKHWYPDRYLSYVLHKPENQILAEVHDRLEQYPYIRAGKVRDIPPGIIEGWLANQAKQKRESEKKHLSSAQVRSAVMASMGM